MNDNFALVLGLDVNGLGIVRSLSEKNIHVFGLYCYKKEELGRFSRFCTPIFCGGGKENPKRILKRIITVSKNLPAKPVLFATSDYYVKFISDYSQELVAYFHFPTVDRDILTRIMNKRLLPNLAKSLSIPVPRTLCPPVNGGVKITLKDIEFPCIIKPADSYSLPFSKKALIFIDPSQLMTFLNHNATLLDKIVIQQIIPGHETNIYQCTCYYNNVKNYIEMFTVEKIHQFPPDFGIMTFGLSVENNIIKGISKSILEEIGYNGFASMEYKWCSITKQYYLIEINPRLPWYNSLFTSCGINFPYIAYMDQKFSQLPARASEVILHRKWLYFRNDLFAYMMRKEKGERKSPKKWLSYILRARSFAYWYRWDAKPFIMANIDFVAWISKKLIIRAFRLKLS
jgi:D-aspartate ligase